MILVTGGAGYIGSHCVLGLLKQGKKVVIFDNLSTGNLETVKDLEKIAARGQLKFFKGDLKSSDDLKRLFKENEIDSVIHFAAYSSVEESTKEPYKYFQNNVSGTTNLLDAMVENNVKYIVYSSSAAVYGVPEKIPASENDLKAPINPYGMTKYTTETILKNYDKKFEIKSIALRYFNVIGADPDGLTGECHNPETHLVPRILKAMKEDNCKFSLFGTDYDTKDGTCIRDYVDVNDLICAHFLALEYLQKKNESDVFNVGTEKGYSVKEIFSACEKVTRKEISYEVCARRAGDPPILCSDTTKIKKILNWKPVFSLEQSILNAWNWECRN